MRRQIGAFFASSRWRHALVLGLCALLAAPPARAQSAGRTGLPVLRDTETEELLRDYMRPILRAAGLEKQNIEVVIINDRSFNAFVVDGRRIFINYGLLTQSDVPNQVIGVIAHETGHIAGGHLAKMHDQLARAQTASIIAMLLGVGAMVAGARSGNANTTQAASAALVAPQSVLERSLLAYQRAQEDQADRAGVKFLNATGQSPKGMYDTFKRLSGENLFAARAANPYLQSHPMPAERVAALEGEARKSPYWDKTDSPELILRHNLVRAKVSGFLDKPDTVLRRYPLSDTSLPARYARAISAYRFGDPRAALGQIDQLIQAQPNNPYFHELKGQALLEGGHPAEAIAPLRHALAHLRNAPLIQTMLAQALIASGNPRVADEAVGLLRVAIVKEPQEPMAYTQLSLAYAKKGDLAEADLAAANAAVMRGDTKTARELATRAKGRFAVGTPGWVRADDILAARAAPPGAPRN